MNKERGFSVVTLAFSSSCCCCCCFSFGGSSGSLGTPSSPSPSPSPPPPAPPSSPPPCAHTLTPSLLLPSTPFWSGRGLGASLRHLLCEHIMLCTCIQSECVYIHCMREYVRERKSECVCLLVSESKTVYMCEPNDAQIIDCMYIHVNGLATLYKIFRHPPYGHVIKLRMQRAHVYITTALQQCSFSQS